VFFSHDLKVSNVFDSLTEAGNSFQMVGAENLKEHPLKLFLHENGLSEDGWYT